MFLHATRRKHVIPGNTFIKNGQGLSPLTLAAKLGRKEIFYVILEHRSIVSYPGFTTGEISPLHPKINLQILYSVLYKFPKVLIRRICLTVKSFLSW